MPKKKAFFAELEVIRSKLERLQNERTAFHAQSQKVKEKFHKKESFFNHTAKSISQQTSNNLIKSLSFAKLNFLEEDNIKLLMGALKVALDHPKDRDAYLRIGQEIIDALEGKSQPNKPMQQQHQQNQHPHEQHPHRDNR